MANEQQPTKIQKKVLNKRSNVVTNGVPKLPIAGQLDYGEIALNYGKGGETMSIKNDKNEIISTPLGIDSILDENSNRAVQNKTITNTINMIKRQLDAVASQNPVYGFARVNGDSDPKGVIFFGKDESLAGITSHVALCMVNPDGKRNKRLAGGRLDLASDGTAMLIDGSDGDIMIHPDTDLYFLKATVKLPTDEVVNEDKTLPQDTEVNVIAMSLSPFNIYGVNAKHFSPFAFSPHYTVNAALTATNNAKGVEDIRSCAHSVYNPNLAGSYSAVYPWFNEVYKANGGGYPSQYISSMNSIWQAQGKNADQKTNRPFMGGYYEFYEIMLSLMFFELKSLYHQSLNSFGCGCTLTSPATSQASFGDLTMNGNSGVMCVQANGTKTFLRLMSTTKITNGTSTSEHPIGGLSGSGWYGHTQMFEAQRVLNDIAKAGLVNKIWKATADDAENQSVVFEYDEDGNMIVSSFTNVELQTGANMTPNKKYYQVRNVPNTDGMNKGVMTAVVNVYVKLTFKDGTTVGTTDHTGGYAVYKLSHPIYRGMSIQDGMYIQQQGCHYVNYCYQGKDGIEDGDYAKFICTDSFETIPPQQAASIQYFGDVDAELEMEKGMTKEIWSHGCMTRAQKRAYGGWAGKDDYSMSLFCVLDHTGGLSTKECQYHWNWASWSNGDAGVDDRGLPAANRKCVNAVVVGCVSGNGAASARAVYGNSAVSYADDDYAGRFALPLLVL